MPLSSAVVPVSSAPGPWVSCFFSLPEALGGRASHVFSSFGGRVGGRVGGQGWWQGWWAGLVSMIDGSLALQARRHSRPDSMHCMQLAGSSSIRPRCRAYAAKRRHYQSPLRKTEKPGPEISGVATAPLVLPVRSSRIHQGPGKARQRSQCVPQFQRRQGTPVRDPHAKTVKG